MTRLLPKHTPVGNQSLHFFSYKKVTWLAPTQQRRYNCGVGRSQETTGTHFASWLMT
ncbi:MULTISPECIES: hypothetical protein [unclassified Sporosarcina]|uniref:hypothetical protein n=1 Tax=unclassified Sporosarcina TaxID=2647733 RepID=UPI0012DCA239|nr:MULTISPECIES: hypothetical protein [unclassified Sporosarcina]